MGNLAANSEHLQETNQTNVETEGNNLGKQWKNMVPMKTGF